MAADHLGRLASPRCRPPCQLAERSLATSVPPELRRRSQIGQQGRAAEGQGLFPALSPQSRDQLQHLRHHCHRQRATTAQQRQR